MSTLKKEELYRRGYNFIVYLEGKQITIRHPQDAIKHHIVMASEDRKELGLVLCRNIKENVSLQNFDKLSGASFIQKPKERKLAKEYTEKMATKMNGIDDLVSSLSGGNQQKVVLAKCLMSEPKVLIMDEPTRGIDVGAKHEIYEIMCDLAKQGKAIIMISSEMSELLGMSDRIYIMNEGKFVGEVSKEEAKQIRNLIESASGACVTVLRETYPGVVIQIEDTKLIVQNNVKSAEFYKLQDKIKTRECS